VTIEPTISSATVLVGRLVLQRRFVVFESSGMAGFAGGGLAAAWPG
jgi:hypothetical protein